ncbi:MAG: acyl-CoA/acyl-ACP dehydrogenase [SAR324 cluster bacterium]|nr:acyl-CoA/acyl-ACP dehydrogenase [SAR324 cluster bacterium]
MLETNLDYKMIGDSALAFAQKELLPHLAENDRYPFVPFFYETFNKASQLEFFHLHLPEALNGWGGNITPLCVILKNMSQVDASMASILLTNAFAQEIILQSGQTEGLQLLLKKSKAPEEFIFAYPLFMNPDIDSLQIEAEKKQQHYSLSGKAEYVVLGNVTKPCLLPAKIKGQNSYSFFWVDLSQSGVTCNEPVLSVGLHACPAVDILLDQVKGQLIGLVSEGAVYFNKALSKMLPAAAAISLGLMKSSFKEAFEYSLKRWQGGRKIINWSELQMILSEMSFKVKTAEMLLEQVCQTADYNDEKWVEAVHAAAIYILDTACEITSEGIQVLGGYGFMKDYFQEKRFRDAQHMQSVFGFSYLRKLNYLNKFFRW